MVEGRLESLVLGFVDLYEVDELDLVYGYVVKKYDNKGNIIIYVYYELKDFVKMINGSVVSRISYSS